MKTAFLIAAIALAAACTHDTPGPTAPGPELSATFTRGALTLQVTDFAAQGGILWALPSVAATPSAVTVQSTRYGSLCGTAVDGSAMVAGSHITLDVNFAERTNAMCTTEIRALRYAAAIAVAAGSYDVTVVHHDGTQADTLVRQRQVTVP